MTDQVTKVKNEGRVAAGKKLAEWNRKNKENLLKNKEQVEPSGEPSAQEPQSQTSSAFYGGGALAIAVVIGVALYTKKPAPPAASPAPPEHDIFCMR